MLLFRPLHTPRTAPHLVALLSLKSSLVAEVTLARLVA